MSKGCENALPFELHMDLVGVLLKSISPRTPEEAKAFIGAPQALRRQKLDHAFDDVIGKKRPAFRAVDRTIPELWGPFYERFFPDVLGNAGGIDALSAVAIPKMRDGFGWSCVLLPGLTHNSVFAACKANFSCYSYYDDIDRAITVNDRFPAEPYGIRVRDRIEADEEYANVSARDVASRGIAGVTLLERMLLELMYWSKTGKHLDLENVTLCSGSRSADGYVPRAGWSDGGFCVDWGGPGYRDPRLRVREILS